MSMRLTVAGFCLAAAFQSVDARSQNAYPLMRPDLATMRRWAEEHERAPRARIDPRMRPYFTSASLLSLVPYVPSERNQGSCGNCWAWAGTGCMEIALATQENCADRLSVQYINSCESGGGYCCAGGWLSDFAAFYSTTGKALPWTNSGAAWNDGDASCDTACDGISATPYEEIVSIADETVPTNGIGQAAAIANIKNVLDQQKGVWFSFFLAQQADWNSFFSFWGTEAESVVWDPGTACGHAVDSGYAGHAVLCVGYDASDQNPSKHYWIMLNSWGTTSLRPNGLFRMKMNIDYDCTYTYGVSTFRSYYWKSLDVTFNQVTPVVPMPVKVNFQPAAALGPVDHFTDTGGAYGPHGGPPVRGIRAYGW